jgi:hypothetical protein
MLSPFLYNVYIDGLIENIAKSKLGCLLGHFSANIIAYADDLVLIAPSITALQGILDTAVLGAADLDIVFNGKKSVCMRFIPVNNNAKVGGSLDCYKQSITLNKERLCFVDKFKYLGFWLTPDLRDDEDILRALRALMYRANFVIRSFSFATWEVKKCLFNAFCNSSFGSNLWWNANRTDMKKFMIGWGKGLKSLFGQPYSVSTSDLCCDLGLLPCNYQIDMSIVQLYISCRASSNLLICSALRSSIYRMSQFYRSFLAVCEFQELFLLDFAAVGKLHAVFLHNAIVL